jgi:hypothetical protein
MRDNKSIGKKMRNMAQGLTTPGVGARNMAQGLTTPGVGARNVTELSITFFFLPKITSSLSKCKIYGCKL